MILIRMRAEKGDFPDPQSDFFHEFAPEAVLRSFAFVHESSGNGEFAPGRLFGAANEEHPAVRAAQKSGSRASGVQEKREAAGATRQWLSCQWFAHTAA